MKQDKLLLQDLGKFEVLKTHHRKLCLYAYSFSSSQSYGHLAQRIKRKDAHPVFSKLRHHIGRLGSWSKASKLLVHVARTNPNLVRNFRVEALQTPSPTEVPIENLEKQFRAVLTRILPAYNIAHLEHALGSGNAPTISDVQSLFATRHRQQAILPYIHAEVFLLDYFHHHNLKFLRGDRYIGCSKRSCYCCDLYIRFHPGKFATRPCHGNVWVKWCPPLAFGTGHQLFDNHNKRILEQMVRHICHDISTRILTKNTRWVYLPDSTTGISPSLPRLVPRH